MRVLHDSPRRKGTIVALSAVLSVFLVGMVAFAVDISYITLTQSQLQNATDASALAGAWPLMDAYVKYQLPGQSAGAKITIVSNAMVSARAKAKEYAGYNGAGGKTSLGLLDEDIEFGFTNDKGVYTANSGMPPAKFPNTIKVVLRRDATSNGRLNLFFAPVLGAADTALVTTARATIFAGEMNGFSVGVDTSGALPVTFDYDDWQQFIKTGTDPDGVKRTTASGEPTLQVYPSLKHNGNFGLISLNDSHVGASTVRGWIQNGAGPADIQVLVDNKLVPTSLAHNAWDWNGENGFKASNVMDINQRIGQTFVIPLFKAKNTSPYQAGVGQGSNFDFKIVAFVGVRITQPDRTNRDVVVQPAAVVDPNATFSKLQPAGSNSSSMFVTTFAPPRLTN